MCGHVWAATYLAKVLFMDCCLSSSKVLIILQLYLSDNDDQLPISPKQLTLQHPIYTVVVVYTNALSVVVWEGRVHEPLLVGYLRNERRDVEQAE